MPLDAFEIEKATTIETKEPKKRVMNNVMQLYNDFFDSYKKKIFQEI